MMRRLPILTDRILPTAINFQSPDGAMPSTMPASGTEYPNRFEIVLSISGVCIQAFL